MANDVFLDRLSISYNLWDDVNVVVEEYFVDRVTPFYENESFASALVKVKAGVYGKDDGKLRGYNSAYLPAYINKQGEVYIFSTSVEWNQGLNAYRWELSQCINNCIIVNGRIILNVLYKTVMNFEEHSIFQTARGNETNRTPLYYLYFLEDGEFYVYIRDCLLYTSTRRRGSPAAKSCPRTP